MNKKTKNIIMISGIVLLLLACFLTMICAKNNLMGNNDFKNGMETPPNMNNNFMMEKSDGDISGMLTPLDKPNGDNYSRQDMPSMPNDGKMPDMKNGNSLTTLYYVIFSIEGLLISTLIVYLIMSKMNNIDYKKIFKSKNKIIIFIISTILLGIVFTYVEVLIANKCFLNTSNIDKTSIPNNNVSQVTYSSVTEITTDDSITSGTYASSNSDENAILVSGDINVDLSNITISKTGDSDGGDNTSFYGNNSSIIAKSGSTLNISNVNITTNANGANAVFSYGGSATTNNSSKDGTNITISDSVITTKQDQSGGIMVTGGGVLNAKNLTITTEGKSSAAIRSDRGGGTLSVDGGTYKTTGIGSPAIYSTAEIIVKNAELVSTNSEGAIIEGKNSITLENTSLTDTNNKLNGQSTTYKNIFLYQSMSGDADTGVSSFTATNSEIITNKGDTFYITNTSSKITLENNIITNNDNDGNFLRCQKDSWGNEGSNGGDVELLMTNQKVIGNIVIDSISKLNMTLNDNSYYEGSINVDNTANNITITLDSTSSIKLTHDSYINELNNSDTSNANIDFNGYKLYVNNKSIN